MFIEADDSIKIHQKALLKYKKHSNFVDVYNSIKHIYKMVECSFMN